MARKWLEIPEDIDILVTHGPPMGILDPGYQDPHVGCEALSLQVDQIQPRLHVFGHCHSGYGRMQKGNTLYVNASSCDERYKLVNKPQVVKL